MYTYPTIRLFKDVLEPGADIYCFSLYDLSVQSLRNEIVSFLKEHDAELCLMLPDFYHDKTAKVVDNTIDILKKELGDKFTSVLTSQLFEDKKKFSDRGLRKYVSAAANIYSSDSLKAATAYCDALFMSHELSAEEIMECSEVLDGTGTALIVQEEGQIPWMQSDFCCCGQNAKDCKFCERQSVFALNGVSSEETKCLAVPHRADCSCTIYGPARNLWKDMDYPDCDIITNRTIIPKGERYG
jgi:putative protease